MAKQDTTLHALLELEAHQAMNLARIRAEQEARGRASNDPAVSEVQELVGEQRPSRTRQQMPLGVTLQVRGPEPEVESYYIA